MQGSPSTLTLAVPSADAEERLLKRIEVGEQLYQRNIRSEQELEQARNDYYTYCEYNEQLITMLFTGASREDLYQCHTVDLLVCPFNVC